MPLHPNHSFVLSTFLALAAASCQNQPADAQTPARLSFNFNNGPTWSNARSYASSPNLAATASWQPVGSFNVVGSAVKSGGWLLNSDSSQASGQWQAGLVSGPLKLNNSETNLGKLTLSFTLSASAARPVKVKIASLDKAGKRTGGLETVIYPAAPDFLQRFALELNNFKPSGAGKFNPTAPQIQLAFEMDGSTWPKGKNELRVDDVNFSAPAFYVSPQGNDSNNGRSETSAFATPQKAVDAAQAGDIIVLMNGTYHDKVNPVASFPRAGSPAAWIVLKNYPGHRPTLTSNGWNTINIANGSKEKRYEGPALAYLEVRGLHVRGEGDVIRQKYPDAVGQSDPRSNTNGIATDGRYMTNTIHHIRYADNIVEYCAGQGLGALEADWVTIEDNISRNNCWTTIYATSGISTLGASNFDTADNIYKILIRNNTVYRNETFEIWKSLGRVSDGNGIIIDVNQDTTDRPKASYLGRTLVQSNLSYHNGGSGIHTVRANRVDIINNTAYMNSASKSLQYSQIYTYGSEDVRIFNNILVAPVANVEAGEKPEPVNRISGPNKNVVFAHNLYQGGNVPPAMGEGDVIADPMFINASTDPKVANFRLKAGSPAIGLSRIEPFLPFLDRDGKPRGSKPDAGAFQR